MTLASRPSPLIVRAERAQRIRQNVLIDDFGCWLWQGEVDEEGYGRLGPGAHRVAYETFVGRVPPGLVIDHTCHKPAFCVCGPRCHHRRCLNPAHMEPVTSRENWLRGQLGQRYLARRAA